MDKQISVYGLVLVGSGISEILAEQLINAPTSITLVQYVGAGIIVVGALIFLAGLVRKQMPSVKLLGITLLAISYAALGFLSILLGGYVFTPLFLLALLCFLLSYGLLATKSWALTGVQLLMVIGIFVSFFLIGMGYVSGVAGILNASYMIWYTSREHVTEYFKKESVMPKLNRTVLVIVLVFSLLFFLPIGYLHYYPPMSRASSNGGTDYTFTQGDVVNCTFQVPAGWPPVTVTMYNDVSGVGVASATGMSGSLVATVPSSGTYVFEGQSSWSYCTFDYDVVVTEYSIRRFTLQFALLDSYLVIAVLSAILLFRPEPNLMLTDVLSSSAQ